MGGTFWFGLVWFYSVGGRKRSTAEENLGWRRNANARNLDGHSLSYAIELVNYIPGQLFGCTIYKTTPTITVCWNSASSFELTGKYLVGRRVLLEHKYCNIALAPD